MSCWRSQPLTCNILREQQQGAARRSWTCTTFTLPRAGIAHPWPLFSPCAALHPTGATLCKWAGCRSYFSVGSAPSPGPSEGVQVPWLPGLPVWEGVAGAGRGAGRGAAGLVQASGSITLQMHSIGLSCARAKRVVLLNCIFRCLKWI